MNNFHCWGPYCNCEMHEQYFWFKLPSGQELCRLKFYRWYLWSSRPQYQSWHLTPCCGLNMEKPTPALKRVEDLGNSYDLNSKRAITLPLEILQEIFMAPIHYIEGDIWHPIVGLRCRISPRHLIELKARVMPLTFKPPSGQELCRWEFYRILKDKMLLSCDLRELLLQ